MAVLAAYESSEPKVDLARYLAGRVFRGEDASVVEPDAAEKEGFGRYLDHYPAGLAIEHAAANAISCRPPTPRRRHGGRSRRRGSGSNVLVA